MESRQGKSADSDKRIRYDSKTERLGGQERESTCEKHELGP